MAAAAEATSNPRICQHAGCVTNSEQTVWQKRCQVWRHHESCQGECPGLSRCASPFCRQQTQKEADGVQTLLGGFVQHTVIQADEDGVSHDDGSNPMDLEVSTCPPGSPCPSVASTCQPSGVLPDTGF